MNKLAAALSVSLAIFAAPVLSAELVVVNLDQGTNAGLDDPSPRSPVGGNPGLTLGEQRRIAYEYAAQMWGAMVESDVPIFVGARFIPQTCTPTSAVLGSAGTNAIYVLSGGGLPQPTLHHSALTDALLGFDVNPGQLDIVSQFNSQINGNPACLGGANWYLGLDGQTPAGQINFLNVVMHEISHGLGFSGFMNVTTGANLANFPDVYNLNAYNNTLAKPYLAMTNAERAASNRDNGNTVWTGPNVTGAASTVLDPRMAIRVTAPSAIRGIKEAGLGTIGPVAEYFNFRGALAPAIDGSGTTTDGCEPLVNASAVSGKIALIDRGTCAFSQKVLNAQAAGAKAVLIADNGPGPVPQPGGDGTGITIPVMGISQADGAQLRAASGVTLYAQQHPTLRAGADANGRVQLYTPLAVAPGSTFSHFDTALSPNALMEPSITGTLRAEFDVDMTPALFADIGWSINTGQARVLSCPTGIPVVDPTGVAAGAAVQANADLCAAYSPNQNAFRSCVVKHAEKLVADRLLTKNEGARVLFCAYTALQQPSQFQVQGGR